MQLLRIWWTRGSGTTSWFIVVADDNRYFVLDSLQRMPGAFWQALLIWDFLDDFGERYEIGGINLVPLFLHWSFVVGVTEAPLEVVVITN